MTAQLNDTEASCSKATTSQTTYSYVPAYCTSPCIVCSIYNSLSNLFSNMSISQNAMETSHSIVTLSHGSIDEAQMGNVLVTKQETVNDIHATGNVNVGTEGVKNDATATNTLSAGGEGEDSFGLAGALDQPNNQPVPYPTRSMPCVRPNIDGPDLQTTLGDMGAQDSTGHPTAFLTSNDEMDVSTQIEKFNFLKTISLNYASNPGDSIATLDLSPAQAVTNGLADESNIVLTMFEFFTLLFRRFRGGFRLKFQLVGPRELAGNLIFSTQYQRWGSAPAYATAYTGQKVSWDFSSSERELVIRVDPVTPYVWLQHQIYNFSGTGAGPTNSYGTLYLYYGSKLTTSTVAYASPPQLNVWIAADPDYQVDNMQMCPNLSWTAPPLSRRPRIASSSTDDSVVILPPSRTSKTTGVKHLRAKPQMMAAKVAAAGTVHEGNQPEEQLAHKPIALAHPPATAGTDIKTLARMWYLYTTLNITTQGTGNILSVISHPQQTIAAQTLWALGASNLFRGTVKIKFTPLSTGWVGGGFIACFNPFASTGDTISITLASQLPHVFVDLSSQSPVILTVPFRHFLDWWDVASYNTGAYSMGCFNVILVNPLQYVTGSSATSAQVKVEISFDDFETFLPSALGLAGVVGHIDVPHMDPVADLSQTTTTDQPLVSSISDEVQGVSTNTGMGQPDLQPRPYANFKNLWKRPNGFHLPDVVLNATTPYQVLDLTPFNPFQYSAGGDGISASLAGMIANLYAGYVGDWIAHLVMRRATGLVNAYMFVLNTRNTSPTLNELLLYTPVPTQAYQASRYGDIPYEGQTFPVSSIPLTTVETFPSEFRCSVPFKSLTRFAGVPSSTSNLATSATNDSRLFLALWTPDATEDTNITVSMDLFTQPGDGARCAVFTGVPTMKVDVPVLLATGDPTNYPDTSLTIE
jgi:hypothetical protein